MLGLPIILDDYPQIAPESRADMFDATEIDEMLALRILTLTGAEKREMREAGPRTRNLLDRVEQMTAADLQSLHGTCRAQFTPGARVRLKPGPGGDVWSLVLNGRTAVVESVEEDFERRASTSPLSLTTIPAAISGSTPDRTPILLRARRTRAGVITRGMYLRLQPRDRKSLCDQRAIAVRCTRAFRRVSCVAGQQPGLKRVWDKSRRIIDGVFTMLRASPCTCGFSRGCSCCNTSSRA